MSWQFWQDSLAGLNPPIINENPQWGFYRKPKKEYYGGKKTFTPVAYYGIDGLRFCRLGDEEITEEDHRFLATWHWVAAHPITEEEYRKVAEEKQPWSDEYRLPEIEVGIGHNQPPDELSFEGLQATVEPVAADARKRLDGPPITSQVEADRIANLADILSELHDKIETARKAERKPHDEALKAIQLKWTPLVLAAEVYKALKYTLLTPWLQLKDREARAAAQAAAQAGVSVEPTRAKVGTRGRGMSLRMRKNAEIVDFEACLTFFKQNPAILDTVQDLANKAVRAGLQVPGVKVLEEAQTV